MTEARSFKVRPAIADQIDQPGGRRLNEILSSAGHTLANRKSDAMDDLRAGIAAIDALCREADDATAPQVQAPIQAQVQTQAAALVDTAGFFDMPAFFRAAYSLCELSELMVASGSWDWRGVAVHVQALDLILKSGGQDTPQSGPILKGLAALVANARPAEA